MRWHSSRVLERVGEHHGEVVGGVVSRQPEQCLSGVVGRRGVPFECGEAGGLVGGELVGEVVPRCHAPQLTPKLTK